MRTEIILATTNNSKIQPFLYSWKTNKLDEQFELKTFKDIGKPNLEVEEDTESFEKDALKKAIAYSKYFNKPTISLDRGIEIPSLDNWPGTLSKDVFTGSSAETKQFNRKDRDLKENEIEMAQYVLDKIIDFERKVVSSYGIAVALPNGESISDVVKFDGTASDELVITEVGWNYDWFYIPHNLGKTLSSLTKDEYVAFTGTYLWPVTERIKKFLFESIK